METTIEIERAGLLKVHDALMEAYEFLRYRDLMNARVHLAREVRFSPITTTLQAELERVKAWLELEITGMELRAAQDVQKELRL